MKTKNQKAAEATLQHVAEILKLEPAEILNKARIRPLVEARMIYCLLCHEHAPDKITLTDIGLAIERDHATVIYNIKQAKMLISFNKSIANKYAAIIESYRTNVLSYLDEFNHIPQY